MSSDPKRQRVVLLGGGSITGFAGDTWEWDGTTWTQREDAGPPARQLARSAWDPVTARTVLFAGRANGPAFFDTWAWDGDQWKQVADMGPSGRQGHALASDAKQVLLHGGLTLIAARAQERNIPPTGGTPPGGYRSTTEKDTWSWNGQRWVQIQDMGPSARSTHAVAFDEKRSAFVLFGGLDDANAYRGDTWEPKAEAGG
jgi:hypothetical protein